MADRIVNPFLYWSAPFFGNPLKVALQTAWCKSDYNVAYQHFKRDHNKATNLLIHSGCLFFQVFGNFALLARLDELLQSPAWGWLSASTLAFWTALLLPQQKSPLPARAAAVMALGLGYSVRNVLGPWWQPLCWPHGILEVAALKTFVKPNLSVPLALAVRWGLQAAILATGSVGKLANFKTPIAATALLLTFVVSCTKEPLKITMYALIGWLLALLTGESAFFWYGCGFSASLLQGISHEVTGEQATLPHLKNQHHEFAHCTYFPAMVPHRVLEFFQEK